VCREGVLEGCQRGVALLLIFFPGGERERSVEKKKTSCVFLLAQDTQGHYVVT